MKKFLWILRIIAIFIAIGAPTKAYLEEDCWPMALFAGFLVVITAFVVRPIKDEK